MSKVFGFRLPADLRTYLEAQSQKLRMSMGSYIVALLKKDKERKELNETHKTQTVAN